MYIMCVQVMQGCVEWGVGSGGNDTKNSMRLLTQVPGCGNSPV